MEIFKKYCSAHFEDTVIPVEFVVLHYTAQSLKESLNIFLSSKVSCHLLIDREGSIYELVDCWEGKVKKAFHAGQSLWQDSDGKTWEAFNNFSLGIELVNWNGNFFPYTKQQYESLFQVLNHFKAKYPQLKNPNRILGHEQIAGFRGKKDPGFFFDWQALFKNIYLDADYPIREPALTKRELESLDFLKKWNDKKAKRVSLLLENQNYPFWFKKTLLYLL